MSQAGIEADTFPDVQLVNYRSYRVTVRARYESRRLKNQENGWNHSVQESVISKCKGPVAIPMKGIKKSVSQFEGHHVEVLQMAGQSFYSIKSFS